MHLTDTPATPAASPVASSLPPLTRADVCIAGAGLPALLAAYLLMRERRSVVVLAESGAGAGQAGVGTARLSTLPDADWRTTLEREGAHGARVTAQSHAAAVDALEAIVRRERIACELERLDAYCEVRGGLHGARAERAAALETGLEDIEIVESLAVPGGRWGPAIRHPGQVRLQPLKLAQGLARAIARGGGRILPGVTAVALDLSRDPSLLTAGGQRIQADVFITTGEPHAEGRLDALAPPRIAHVVGVHVPRGALAQALYRDARESPIDAGLLSHGRGAGEVLLVGGEDPPGDDDHTAFRYLALERWTQERFPGAGPVVHRGTVQVVPDDELFAYGLANAQGMQACARGGSALTRMMLDALAIADFVQGSDSAWSELYLRPPPRQRAVHAA